MSNTSRPGHRTQDVVVGVDGTPASTNALRYARAEAARSGGRVDVFHVVPDYVPLGLYTVAPDDLMEAGRAALDASVSRLEPVDDGVLVQSHLRRGAVVKTLTAAARDARELVVGSDRRPASLRLLTGNVSTGVAARSAVPVVSVPETWCADRATGTVLVAVKHPEHSEALMAEGFDVARRRGSRLIVLHAGRLPAAYDDIIASDPHTLAEWDARAKRELEALVAPWQGSHGDIDVELRTVHDHSAHALVEASGEADELVIVRRAHGFPPAAHLGSTARTVLLYAHCPVRVVPAVDVPVPPDLDLDLDLEAAGGVLKQVTTRPPVATR